MTAQKRKFQEVSGSQLSAVALRRQLRNGQVAATSATSTKEHGQLQAEILRQQDIHHSRSLDGLGFLHSGYPISKSGDEDRGLTSDSSSHTSSAPSEQLPSARFSTFNLNSDSVVHNTYHHLQVRLGPGETLVVIGEYDLRITNGIVLFLGAILGKSPSYYRVYVSSTHSLPAIKAMSNAEIDIRYCKSGIRQLKRVSPYFSGIWARGESDGPSSQANIFQRSFQLLYDRPDNMLGKQIHLLDIPKSWDAAILQLSNPRTSRAPQVLVCGPKSSGKSTFTRLLTNRILAKVVHKEEAHSKDLEKGVILLDIDPGQPEFSPPGQLSLIYLRNPTFGPPFSHPSVPRASGELIRAHSVATMSPKENPIHYHNCVVDLCRVYWESHRSVPLVVNCSGWIVGGGLDVLLQLIHAILPTDLVFMSDKGPSELVDLLKTVVGDGLVHLLPSQAIKSRSRPPSSLRAMQIISYFHVKKPEFEHLQWDSASITSRKPWIVRYNGECPGVFGIITLGEVLPAERLITVLDGAVASVVVIENESALQCQDKTYFGTAIADSIRDANGRTIRGNEALHEKESASEAVLDHSDSPKPNRSPDHSYIHRTSVESLPYFHHGISSNPLNPAGSHCIGLALVRGIDVRTHTLQLITPISTRKIQELNKLRCKIVLVLGKFDPPEWAYVDNVAQQSCRASRAKGSIGHDEQLIEVAEKLRYMQRGDRPWVAPLKRDSKPVEERIARTADPG